MRKLTKDFKKRLRKTFHIYANGNLPEETLIDIVSGHFLGLLEIVDEHPEWFITESSSKVVSKRKKS